MPVSVLTQHNDNGRTGSNLQEKTLKVANVNVNQFGKVFSHAVQGQIYAQPLYVPFVAIAGKGVHNVVFVATMENWVYAFDADDSQGPNAAPLWARQIHENPVPPHVYRDTYNDITGPFIGILSTPVIDAKVGSSAAAPSTGTLYLVLATWDPVLFKTQPQQAFKQLLYAINLADGQPRPSSAANPNPVPINGSAPGVGYAEARESDLPAKTVGGKTTIDTKIGFHQPPTPPKAITVVDASGGEVVFSPMQHMQRPALLFDGGVLYVAFGSHGDYDPYHGWVFAYDAATFQQRGIFCATPNGAKGGIWQAGEGPVANGNGEVFVGTGNGDSKLKPGANPDLGQSYIRLKAGGGSLSLTGWVTLIQDATNPVFDEDLGAASPTLLPDGHLVGGGKDGNFYLVDPSGLNLAGTQTCVTQTFLASRGRGSRADVFDQNGKLRSTHHIHGSPIFYDSAQHGVLVYVWGENDVVRAYHYDPVAHTFPGQPNQRNQVGTPMAQGSIFASNDIPDRSGMPGGMLSLSADAKVAGTAILWASFPPFLNANMASVDGELVAYDACQFDSHNRLVALFRSHQNPPRDDYGKFAKFCSPTIANGRVYVATFSNRLSVYGLLDRQDGGYDLGFGGKTGLTMNGSARANAGPVRLTGQHPFQSGSVFCTTPVAVGRFSTSFRFQLNNAHADGLTFTIQSEGPHALGGVGGGLGYGPDPGDALDPGYKITKSIAVKFDLFDNLTGRETSSTGLYRNGESPSGGPDTDLEPLGIRFHTGHHFSAKIVYDGTTLTVTIRDDQTRITATQSYPVDIPAIVGAIAHVGFTAATGGLMAEHDVLAWQFSST